MTRYTDVELLQYLQPLVRDINFRDIETSLKRHQILHASDLSNITVESCFNLNDAYLSMGCRKEAVGQMKKQEQDCMDKLCLYLIYSTNNNAIEEFFDIIEQFYPWITDAFRKERDNRGDNNEIDNYRKFKSHLFEKLPSFDESSLVHRCNFVWKLQKLITRLNAGEKIIVTGSYRYGKKWLIMDTCCTYPVFSSMKERKIIWLDMTRVNTELEIYYALLELKIQLGFGTDNQVPLVGDTKLVNLSLKIYMKDVFNKPDMNLTLLVLDNIQSKEVLEAFRFHCKTIYTSKNSVLGESIPNSTKFSIYEGFTLFESLQLMKSKVKNPLAAAEESETWMKKVHSVCCGNPFIISMVAANISKSDNPIANLKDWFNELRLYISTQIDHIPIGYFVSLLKDDKYINRYKSLVIFMENVRIPITVLEAYWKTTRIDVDTTLDIFSKYMLCKIVSYKNVKCSQLDYIYYLHLMSECSAELKKKMHREFIENHNFEEVFLNRVELEPALEDKIYFYYNLCYHLKESDMQSYFPKLFWDFGILEALMRNIGLGNTISTLQSHRYEIAITGRENETFDDLLDLIHYSEHALHKSDDSKLLQRALLSKVDFIREKALEQAKPFKTRAWFVDGGSFLERPRKNRDVFVIPDNINFVKFIDADTILVASENPQKQSQDKIVISLCDLSFSYLHNTVNYRGHEASIIDIQLVERDYFISVDCGNVIHFYSLLNTFVQDIGDNDLGFDNKHRLALRSINLNIPDLCYPVFSISDKHAKGIYLQKYDTAIKRYSLFVISEPDNEPKGKIYIYDWTVEDPIHSMRIVSTITTSYTPIVLTTIELSSAYLVALCKTGKIYFHNLYNDAATYETPEENDMSIGLHKTNSVKIGKRRTENIVVVYEKCIKFVTCQNGINNVLSTTLNKVKLQDCFRKELITTSCISDDKNFLFIGTKRGVFMINVETQKTIHRLTISDSIRCIDIFELEDDDTAKYLMITGSQQYPKLVNIERINHNNLVETDDYYYQPIFSIIERPKMNGIQMANGVSNGNDLIENELISIVLNSNNEIVIKKDLIKTVDKRFSQPVYKIIGTKNYYYVAYGMLVDKICIDDMQNSKETVTRCPYIVNYLKCFETENLTVVGYKAMAKIILNGKETEYNCKPIYDCFIDGNGFLLIIDSECYVMIINLRTLNMEKVFLFPNSDNSDIRRETRGVAFNKDLLVIANNTNVMKAFSITYSNSDPSIRNLMLKFIDEKERLGDITCLAISANKLYVAVGFKKGLIQIYKITTNFQFINYTLNSHKSDIQKLIFSPWTEEYQPIILLSLSEQICLWSINFVVHNVLGKNANRRSQRYSRTGTRVPPNPMSNGNYLKVNGNGYSALNLNPWVDKQGPRQKPALLASMKFVGHNAKDVFVNSEFTRFITVDDEGEIYDHSMLQQNVDDTNDSIILNGANEMNGTNGYHL